MNITQTKILFSYTESVTPPKCRKPRDMRFHDGVVDVDIRYVTKDEAPVALVHRKYDYDGKTVLDTAEYRWFEERLWTRMQVEFNFGTLHGPAPAAVIDATASGAHASRNHPYNTAAECRKQFVDWAATFIVIDGEKWEPVDEPRYYVDDESTYGVYVKVHHDFRIHSHRERYFSLRQLSEAKALAQRENRERERDLGDQDILSDRFEILLPGVIKVNVDEKVEVIVFGLADVNHSQDLRRQEQHLLEVTVVVPKDALASKAHLDIANRSFHEQHDRYPQTIFDEYSPAGQVIMALRQRVKTLMDEKLTKLGQSPLDVEQQEFVI
ncbi:hypothetical protein BSFA1_81020 (plasmid) [Burkholderia sp. SFA1]|nr:hypothetical protein BYI23_E001960 [Burkholderia sp. YI23]BBQ02974.1 hypothetical protein BSFA1_81020 [Burkholderia sp. SFA1]